MRGITAWITSSLSRGMCQAAQDIRIAITRLIVKLDSLGKDMDDLELHNHESHKRLWDRNDEQDEKLADHEGRIKVLENEKERK